MTVASDGSGTGIDHKTHASGDFMFYAEMSPVKEGRYEETDLLNGNASALDQVSNAS